MALSKEGDDVLVSMLPYGPWFRYPTWSGHGGELVRAWLGRSLTAWCFHGFPRCFFGAFSCRNVTFVRKGLSDGLSWVSPDELSGLACKSVLGAFTCVLEACAVKSVERNAVDGRPGHAGLPTFEAFSYLCGILKAMALQERNT